MADETKKQLSTNSGFRYSYEELNGSRIKLTIEIPALVFSKEEEKAYHELSGSVKMQGFRPGKAPDQMMRAQLGAAPYERALNELLPKSTLEVVNELTKSENRNMAPLDNVSYELAKVQPSKGVVFHATYTIFPIVKLGDLSKIKVNKQKVEVTQEEIQKVINQMFEDWKKQNDTKESDYTKSDSKEDKVDERKTEKENKVLKYDKPNDEWVEKEIGMDAKTLPELEKLVKDELLKQKEIQEGDRVIDEILNQVINTSVVDVPESFINIELDREEEQYKKRIENIGLSVDDFLKNQDTTMKDLRRTWTSNVKKRIQVDLILLEVSNKYNLTVSDEEILSEINTIEDASLKAQYNTDEGKRYIKDIKLRQKSVEKLKSEVKIS